MSFSPFSSKLHLRWFTGVTCLAFSLASHAADPRGNRAIEITPPRGQSINTNINQLRLSGLKNLEADLSKPFQSMSPQPSLDGIMAPQMLPQPQSRPVLTQKEKDKRDRQKNWAFMDPEEFGPNLTPEKIFGLKEYGADGLEKKSSTTVERFTERMNAMGTNQLATSDASSTNLMWGDDSSIDPARQGNVFTTVNPSIAVFKPASQPAAASDVFNFNPNRATDDMLREEKAQKAQVENFRQLWNYDQGASAATPGLQNSSFNAGSDAPAKTFQPVLGTALPHASAPAQSSLTPQAPAPTPARTTTFQPDFAAPQRRF